MENIIYCMDKKDVLKYLKENDYILDEISDIWSSFYIRFKWMCE